MLLLKISLKVRSKSKVGYQTVKLENSVHNDQADAK